MSDKEKKAASETTENAEPGAVDVAAGETTVVVDPAVEALSVQLASAEDALSASRETASALSIKVTELSAALETANVKTAAAIEELEQERANAILTATSTDIVETVDLFSFDGLEFGLPQMQGFIARAIGVPTGNAAERWATLNQGEKERCCRAVGAKSQDTVIRDVIVTAAQRAIDEKRPNKKLNQLTDPVG